jgi:hypothetical protein
MMKVSRYSFDVAGRVVSMLRERIRQKRTENSSGFSVKVSRRNALANHPIIPWRDARRTPYWEMVALLYANENGN